MITLDFQTVEPLIDGDLLLELAATSEGLEDPDPMKHRVPAYNFAMRNSTDKNHMGNIRLRLGTQDLLVNYIGQIGYDVKEEFRGQGYAARSLQLLLPLARNHGFEERCITCNPDNEPSKRTLIKSGFELIEKVETPKGMGFHKMKEFEKLRYRIAL